MWYNLKQKLDIQFSEKQNVKVFNQFRVLLIRFSFELECKCDTFPSRGYLSKCHPLFFFQKKMHGLILNHITWLKQNIYKYYLNSVVTPYLTTQHWQRWHATDKGSETTFLDSSNK